MQSTSFKTFAATQTQAILTVTFNFPPVNIQGIPMIKDLDDLAAKLEQDKKKKMYHIQMHLLFAYHIRKIKK